MVVWSRFLLVCCACLVAGCGARSSPVVLPDAPPSLPVSPLSSVIAAELAAKESPLAAVVVLADAEFAAGERELRAGRVVAAREHFDRAIDHLLAVPVGARSDATTSAAFDRLLDRISALDLLALREGDGLTETNTEPAAIDELLNVALFARTIPAATTAETVRADLLRFPLRLDIPLNDRVLSFVELFQGRLSDFLMDGLGRGYRYLPMIRQVFAEAGLPEELIYVPLVESAFKSNALSRASARGLWQFMPATGREYGLQQTWFIDERSDPEKATRAAAQYLRVLWRMFDGDWSLALASYNAGPGRVQRAMRTAGLNDFWQLTASTRYLPRETRDYVPMIMAAVLIARNPQLYGLNVEANAPPFSFERVVVPNAIDLKILAEWSGVTVDEIRAINPELRRTTTPMGSHELKVPVGTAATIQRQLASADSLFVHFTHHTVRRGDTVASIARRYRVSVAELRQANELTARSVLRANQTLMIPQHPTQALPAAVTRTAAASQSSAPTVYRVQRGDTLYSIARRFETTVDAIKQLNSLRSNTINIGDRLTVR